MGIRTGCVVVEIPDPQYGTIFATARQDFLDLIVNSNINQKKQIVPPVRLTVVGPAFFDGQLVGPEGPASSHRATATAIRQIARCGRFIPCTKSGTRERNKARQASS
jgi:hypothetical protein